MKGRGGGHGLREGDRVKRRRFGLQAEGEGMTWRGDIVGMD